MIAIVVGASSFAGFIACLFGLAFSVNGQGTALLVVIAAVCFIACCWALGAFQRESRVDVTDDVEPTPIGVHPAALSRLDRLDGLGSRRLSEHYDRQPRP